MRYWWRVYNYRMYAPDGLGGGAGSTIEQPEAEGEAAPEATTAPDGGVQQTEPTKTFTQADIDRIVSKTIKQEREKAEKLAQQAREKANH